MISQGESGDLIGILTNIQSIYDRASNRTLLLRLRWPSTSPSWSELSKLAEKLGQARENVGAVVKILMQKRNGGVELSCEVRLLKPLQNVVNKLHRSLLAPIEHERGDSKPTEATEKLAQVSADGQKNSLFALVRIFEEPQRKMSAEDRLSLAATLKRESLLSCLTTEDCQRGARDSIFAPPVPPVPPMPSIKPNGLPVKPVDASAKPKGANNRIQYLRSASLGSNGQADRNVQQSVNVGSSVSPSPPPQQVQAVVQPSLPHPQRSSSLAPIPVIEPEAKQVYVAQNRLPTPPEEFPNPYGDEIKPKKFHGNFPFLPIDSRSSSALKPYAVKTITLDRSATREPAVPQFMSSPLSDSPMPKLPNIEPYPSSANTTNDPTTDDIRPPKAQRVQDRAQDIASAETAMGRFSPFSEPDYEASGSYFAPRPGTAKLVEVASNNRQRAYGRPSSKTITGSHPLQNTLAPPPDTAPVLPRPTIPLAPQQHAPPPPVPSNLRPQAPQKLPTADQTLPKTQYIPAYRPQIPHSVTDQVTGAPRSQVPHLAVPPVPQQPNSNQQRPPLLSMASPVDDTRDTLPQPSAWNDYLGFCVGAALSQAGQSDAIIQTKNANNVHFLKCSNNKCAFQGHGPADKIWESSGVYFRREFLVKSHCKQKKSRHAIYAFQCIFCVLMRQKSPVIQGTDAFLAHVAGHRSQTFSSAVLERTRCVAGRKASQEEIFDVNLPPVNGPVGKITPGNMAMMRVESTPSIAGKAGSLDMFQALHSNPMGR